jgi:hypothetical protein
LQFSTVGILVSIILATVVALAPIVLALFKLPGKIVIAANNSAVLAAACHCIPVTTSGKSQRPTSYTPMLEHNFQYDSHEMTENILNGTESLKEMAKAELKWGVVVKPAVVDAEIVPGHLAFGSLDQEIGEVVRGEQYEGIYLVCDRF